MQICIIRIMLIIQICIIQIMLIIQICIIQIMLICMFKNAIKSYFEFHAVLSNLFALIYSLCESIAISACVITQSGSSVTSFLFNSSSGL